MKVTIFENVAYSNTILYMYSQILSSDLSYNKLSSLSADVFKGLRSLHLL